MSKRLLMVLRLVANVETRAGRWTITILVYTISYGFMLPLGNARFWDDWSSHFYSGTDFLSGQTFPFRQPLDDFLINTSGGFWLYRPLTFAAFLACGWFVWRISEYPPGFLRTSERTVVVLLFLVLPLNSVRVVAQSLFSYTFSTVFFFLGWSIWVRQSRFFLFFPALACFILSFPTHSLLFFAAGPALHVLVSSSIPLASRLLQIGVLGTTSFLFRPIMSLIRPDLQLNEGYNTMLPAFLMRASLVLLSVLALAAYLMFKASHVTEGETRRCLKIISAGLALFALGLFPYMAVGHFPNVSDLLVLFIPNLTENDSRHSLLLPIGTAVTLVGIGRHFLKRESLTVALAVSLLTCAFLNVSIYSQYYTDKLKQDGIVHQLENIPQTQLSSRVMFIDESTRFNARGRDLYTFEFLGLLKEAGYDTDFRIISRGDFPCSKSELASGTVVTITSDRGRLRAIITGAAGIILNVKSLDLCGEGWKRA